MGDQSSNVRVEAVLALGKLGSPKALSALSWVRDKDAEVWLKIQLRGVAAWAIQQIKRKNTDFELNIRKLHQR